MGGLKFMNLNELEQTRKKLAQEYNDNCKKIDELNKKICCMQSNRFESKLMGTFALSILPMLGSLALTPIIYNGVIPFNVLQPLTFFVPYLIGFVGEIILFKKRKYKEKLKSFSSAKCEQEFLQEQTQYEIEKEKLKNQNRILEKACGYIESEKKALTLLSDKYNITEKDSEENIDEIIINLNKELEKNKELINIATAKKELSNKFCKCREKFSIIDDVCKIGLIGFLASFMCEMLYNMPLLYVNNNTSFHIDPSLIGILSPAIIGGLVVIGYEFIKSKNNKTAFRNINNSLGENSISEKSNYEEDKHLEKKLEKVISDTCTMRIRLEEARQKLKKLQKKENITNEQEKSIGRKKNMSINEQVEQLEHIVTIEKMCESVYCDVIDNCSDNESVKKERGPLLKKTLY